MTLKLAFPDGQAMTHGSACRGAGCLQQGADIEAADAAGVVVVPDGSDRTIEYRRDGIDLAQAPAGDASGQVQPAGTRATVVLPHLLSGTDPVVDAAESDVVARINAERSARGLPPAELSMRLSTAADYQATWLSGNAAGVLLPILSHIGPFGSTLPFRLGEVSFPQPTTGAEIASVGATPAEALTSWLASTLHRELVLAPGALILGVGRVGSVIIVETHPPCSGCSDSAPVNSGSGAAVPPRPAGAGGSGGAPAAPRPASAVPSCGVERLGVRRLRDRHKRMRLRVDVRCLRRGVRYSLSVIQRPSMASLTTRKIKGAGTIPLSLRPARTTRTLRIKLKRAGRAVAVRSVNRRTAARR